MSEQDPKTKSIHSPEPKLHPELPLATDTSTEPKFTKSYLVQRIASMIPILDFSSLKEDTFLHCMEGQVSAPSQLLVLLAPWLGELLQEGRGQEGLRNLHCPDLRADSLTRFINDVQNKQEKIYTKQKI